MQKVTQYEKNSFLLIGCPLIAYSISVSRIGPLTEMFTFLSHFFHIVLPFAHEIFHIFQLYVDCLNALKSTSVGYWLSPWIGTLCTNSHHTLKNQIFLNIVLILTTSTFVYPEYVLIARIAWVPKLPSSTCSIWQQEMDKTLRLVVKFLETALIWNIPSYYMYYLIKNRKILTSDCWLSFKGMMLTHLPAFLRFGRSLWTPDPVGISLVSIARSPLSAVPPDITIQSFLIPGLYKPLKQTANLLALKATCSKRRHNQEITVL